MELLEESPSAGPPAEDRPGPSAMTAVAVRVAGPLTIASAKGSHADIASVTVTVAGDNALGNHQDPLASADLESSPDGMWVGTLSGLTVGAELTFTARARDGNDSVIFEGTHVQTLANVGAQITIRLNAVDDGEDNRFPKVSAISISNVSTGVPAEVSITVHTGPTRNSSISSSPAARSIPSLDRSPSHPAPGPSPACTRRPILSGGTRRRSR